MRRWVNKPGFSLLEVVIVVAIIAILAAIGIPRMSRGSKGANDAALKGDLAVLRNAIDLFSAEHGGSFPTAANIENQLQQYSDVLGAVSPSKSATHIYGPYIRTIPPLPVGAKKGQNGIAAVDDVDVGWIYTATDGSIRANCTPGEVDDANVPYMDY